MNKPKRYHPLMVTLHWLVAGLAFINLLLGLVFFRSATLPQPVVLHMALGILVLVLIVVRLIARLAIPRPADATTGIVALDWIGRIVHYGLYFFLALITIVGILMTLRSGEFQYSLLGSADSLGLSAIPGSILGISLRLLHRISAISLASLITLHVLAAIYHQFLLRDRLLSRMWYGQR